MTLRYLSLCSGIEAASVAWKTLGWQAVAFAEIEPFPCAVLAHHYRGVPNLGDMTKINGRAYRERVDVLVGGTPCQSFSVAGLRRGLDDERGNLALEFVRIEELCAEEKLLYLYLFTSPHTNNLGILEITRRKTAFESGLSVEAVNKGIARFEADGKAVTDGNMVWLTNFVKNQTSTSGKLIKGLCELLAETGSEKICSAVCKRYPALFGGMDAVSNGTDTASKGMDTPAKGRDTLSIPSGEEEEEREEEGGIRARGGKPLAPEKDRYRENGNVLLTRTQYENLCARFGKERTDKAIALLDVHIGAKGKDEYKDHNLALQKWAFDAVKEREARQTRASPGPQRAGMSRNGNTDAGGKSRDYGQSIIPDWGQKR